MAQWQPLVRRRTQSLNPYNPIGTRLYGNAPMVVTQGATYGHPNSIPSAFHHRRLTSGNAGYPWGHPHGGTAYQGRYASQGFNSARGYMGGGHGGMGEEYVLASDYMSPRRGFTEPAALFVPMPNVADDVVVAEPSHYQQEQTPQADLGIESRELNPISKCHGVMAGQGVEMPHTSYLYKKVEGKWGHGDSKFWGRNKITDPRPDDPKNGAWPPPPSATEKERQMQHQNRIKQAQNTKRRSLPSPKQPPPSEQQLQQKMQQQQQQQQQQQGPDEQRPSQQPPQKQQQQQQQQQGPPGSLQGQSGSQQGPPGSQMVPPGSQQQGPQGPPSPRGQSQQRSPSSPRKQAPPPMNQDEPEVVGGKRKDSDSSSSGTWNRNKRGKRASNIY